MTICSTPASATRPHRPLAGRVGCLALALLGGCADVHWERAFYDGFRRCPPGHSAPNESCGKGPAYEHYELERERLQADKPRPPASNNPIEVKQL